MKKKLLVLLLAFSLFSVQADNSLPGVDMPFPLGIVRGAVALLQCPLELPRAIAYCSTSADPGNEGAGVIGGVLASPFLMFVRAVVSAADICTLGLAGEKWYSEHFAPMIWHSRWDARRENPPKTTPAARGRNLSNIEQLQQRAEAGDADAQNSLGFSYENGRGVAKNQSQAVYWYRKAANQNFAMAQCNLGICYENGQGVEKDVSQAIYWYRKAAEQNYANAQFCLGLNYENGIGVEKDIVQAVYWYKKAATQGHANAQNSLGVAYYSGQGVEKDVSQAVNWFRRAAEQGNKFAQCNLGDCYRDGDGVTQNLERARYWFRKSMAQGYDRARKNLEKLEQ